LSEHPMTMASVKNPPKIVDFEILVDILIHPLSQSSLGRLGAHYTRVEPWILTQRLSSNRRRRPPDAMSDPVTLLSNGQDTVHVMHDMVSLHLYNEAYRHSLVFPIGFPKIDRSRPSVRNLFQELQDVVSVGLEQVQRRVQGAVCVSPPLGPDVLRKRPVPLERELGLLVSQRLLDTCLPEIVSVRDVMHNLSNGPAAL
jgi:hypothetical protein